MVKCLLDLVTAMELLMGNLRHHPDSNDLQGKPLGYAPHIISPLTSSAYPQSCRPSTKPQQPHHEIDIHYLYGTGEICDSSVRLYRTCELVCYFLVYGSSICALRSSYNCNAVRTSLIHCTPCSLKLSSRVGFVPVTIIWFCNCCWKRYTCETLI